MTDAEVDRSHEAPEAHAPPVDETPVGDAAPEAQPVAPVTAPPTVSPRRRLFESIVLFVSAILFIRTVAVEPFGVPTGSMAPLLSGNHRAVSCSRCGYVVRVGEPSNKGNGYPDVICPNCGAVVSDVAVAGDVAGDRLLVDKNVFRLRSPRRWEVGVFICPSDKSKPYVKRIVGRPGETVQLRGGDVWIDGELNRKTFQQARECRVPVFTGDHAPSGGWHRRWLAEGTQPALSDEPASLPPWATLDPADLAIWAEGSPTPRMLAYWNVSLESLEAEVVRDTFEYNGYGNPAHPDPVHDFFLEFEVEVLGGRGEFIAKLNDGETLATATLAAGGESGISELSTGGPAGVQQSTGPSLKQGKRYRVEMAMVDRRITVAVDGKPLMTHDLPVAARRADVTSPFRLGAKGVDVVIRHVRLFRDIHYRIKEGETGFAPHRLGPDEYFLLGDNTANSDDSRTWQIPAVPERNFLGKPFLLHQPSRPAHWDVGGRAVDSQGVDWQRIRWLR